MLKLKWLHPIVCLVIITCIGGPAWGYRQISGDESERGTSLSAGAELRREIKEVPVQVRKIVDLSKIRISPPWPTTRANPARTGRSELKGPGSSFVETASVDLFSGVLEYLGYYSGNIIYGEILDESKRGEKLGGLLIGPGNRLYFRYNQGGIIFSYDITGGQQWFLEIVCESAPGLGGTGQMFTKFSGPFRGLFCRAVDGTKVWSKHLPGPGGPHEFFSLGRQLYVDAEWGENENDERYFHVAAFNFSGNQLWMMGPFFDKFQACAEDAQGNAYFRDASPALHKVDTNGNIIWSESFSVKTGDEDNDLGIGPICGDDGRIWVCTKDTSVRRRKLAGLPYVVLNSDGSEYKSGGFGNKGTPSAACYGGDGRLYVGFSKGIVACYDDWNNEVWSTQMFTTEGEDLLDMVMDVDNNIYVVLTAWGVQTFDEGCYLAMIDGSDGSVRKLLLLDVPALWVDSPSQLAIGGSGKLYYLNSAGYLKEFRTLRIKPGAFKEIQGG